MKLSFVVKSLIEKKIYIYFVLECEMQGDLFIPESWTKMSTWVEEIQLVAMEITRCKSSQISCTIEYQKHKSFYLTPSLLLDFKCNLKHELKRKENGTCQAI